MDKRLKSLYGHLFCILVILCEEVPCQATEYCVKSTAADHENVSYHGQPCHTIDHYIDPLREYLKLNNTVFTFLPGEHVMKQPLVIENVENITLQVMSNEMVTLFSVSTFVCDIAGSISFENMYYGELVLHKFNMGCSILRMSNVTDGIVSGLTIVLTKPGVSAIVIHNCTDIHIQGNDVSFYYRPERPSGSLDDAGILVIDSHNIFIYSFRVRDTAAGIAIVRSNNVSITNTESMICIYFGIVVSQTNHTHLILITVSGNRVGLLLMSVKNTTLQQVHSMSNRYGISLENSVDTFIGTSLVKSNFECGILLLSCVSTEIRSSNVSHNIGDGIEVLSCYFTSIIDTNIMKNKRKGIEINDYNFEKNSNLFLCNVYAVENTIGVHVSASDTEMVNVIAIGNFDTGISMHLCFNTTLNGVTVDNNVNYGVYNWQCDGTTLMEIHAVATSSDDRTIFEILIVQSNNTILRNATVKNKNDEQHCINIIQSYNTTLMDITITLSGVFVEESTNVTLRNVSVDHIAQSGLTFLKCRNVLLEESTFRNVDSNSLTSNTDVLKLSAIFALQNTSFIVRNCSFIDSNTSSIMATGSTIQVEGNILFSNISAISGAAFIFSKSSALVLSEQSIIVFQNNHVRHYGTAFYIITEELTDTSIYISNLLLYNVAKDNAPLAVTITSVTKCFIHVEGTRSTARLIFINNTAERGGDVVYGGLVALGYDGDWNCLLSFKNISDMRRQSSEMPSRRITSAPSRVCICRDDMPDCLVVADTTPHVLYPGQTMTVSAAVVGQDFGTVKGEVNAHVFSSFDLYLPPEQQVVLYDNGECRDLNYTVYSSCDTCEAELVLTPDDREISKSMSVTDNLKINTTWSILLSEPNYKTLATQCVKRHENNLTSEIYYDEVNVNDTIEHFFIFSDPTQNGAKLRFPSEIYTYPLYITVSIHPCPLGFTISQSKCDCIPILQHIPTVECNIQGPTITRGGSVWIGTFDKKSVAISKYCPLHYCKTDTVLLSLHLQNSTNEVSQCNYNHAGVLCGGCQHGHSLALGSEQCLHCSNAYIILILPFALAGIFLVCFIKVLNITVCQGTINGLIFYANVVNANKHLYYDQTTTNPITLFIAWFNLDLGIKTCLYDGLTAYARTWLQFVFPLYIWSLAGGIIFLANHSRRVAKLSGNNGVPVLATLFLLSYAKLFTTIIKAVSYTTLYTTQGDKLVWSVDGNIDFIGPKHAPLFATAVAALVFLWLPYTLLLLFGKYLHKINCRLITRILMKLKPFLDANYAPFNDRHQYWFGGILIVKAVVLLSSAIIPANGSHVVVFSVALSSFMLTFWGQMVFCKGQVAIFHTWNFVNLGILTITKLFTFDNPDMMSLASFTLIGLTLMQFLGFFLFKVINYVKWRHTACCFRKGGRLEDDWELYFQAPEQLQNETEKDDDEEDEPIFL